MLPTPAGPNPNDSLEEIVMASKALPCPTVLRQLLRYEPETGKLFWRKRSSAWFEDGQKSSSHRAAVWNAKYAGKEAFTPVGTHGYKNGSVFNVSILAHRAIWAMVTGAWPARQIDHINGIKTDNALSNLRHVENSENSKNRCVYSLNKTGKMGVHKIDGKWRAQIGLNYKTVSLGRFDSFEEALRARETAEIKYGFHENHGRA